MGRGVEEQEGNNKQPHVDQPEWLLGNSRDGKWEMGGNSKDRRSCRSRNNSITNCVNKNDGVEDKATALTHP